jgi:hypothetical protein
MSKNKTPQYPPVVVVKGFYQSKEDSRESARKFLVELGTNKKNGKLTKK